MMAIKYEKIHFVLRDNADIVVSKKKGKILYKMYLSYIYLRKMIYNDWLVGFKPKEGWHNCGSIHNLL